jgi:hypothetical protein
MKIGIICECGPQGAEMQVFPEIVKKLGLNHKIDPVPMENKPKLVEGCGKAAKQLLESGCERVLIVWDLYPGWRVKGQKPCRKEDREAILSSLRASKVDLRKAKLICIKEELEAWLLSDGDALSEVLSRPTHKVKVKNEKNPDNVSNPKGRMRKIFQLSGKSDYNDMTDAIKIARALPNTKKLLRSSSFDRFRKSL